MVPIHLLVVHSHPLLVAGIHALVARLDHWQVVGHAANAFGALRFLQNQVVDVVLTEQRLPGLSGVALCGAIRRTAASISLGIIGELTPFEQSIALSHGVGLFLTPQVTQRDLNTLAKRLAHHRREHAQFYHRRDVYAHHATLAKQIPVRQHMLPATMLSNRELDVVQMLSRGSTSTQIAEQLRISSHTVKQHITNAMHKCAVHTRRELIAYAEQQDWLVR
jgi:DNA-binding NarL/FixJ family response regulator